MNVADKTQDVFKTFKDDLYKFLSKSWPLGTYDIRIGNIKIDVRTYMLRKAEVPEQIEGKSLQGYIDLHLKHKQFSEDDENLLKEICFAWTSEIQNSFMQNQSAKYVFNWQNNKETENKKSDITKLTSLILFERHWAFVCIGFISLLGIGSDRGTIYGTVRRGPYPAQGNESQVFSDCFGEQYEAGPQNMWVCEKGTEDIVGKYRNEKDIASIMKCMSNTDAMESCMKCGKCIHPSRF